MENNEENISIVFQMAIPLVVFNAHCLLKQENVFEKDQLFTIGGMGAKQTSLPAVKTIYP